jgi:transaldolase
VGQITALAGCDRLTIAPNLLEELAADESALPRLLSPENATGMPAVEMGEATFRWEMNEDAMATEKVAEGIRNFHADTEKLYKLIAGRM